MQETTTRVRSFGIDIFTLPEGLITDYAHDICIDRDEVSYTLKFIYNNGDVMTYDLSEAQFNLLSEHDDKDMLINTLTYLVTLRRVGETLKERLEYYMLTDQHYYIVYRLKCLEVINKTRSAFNRNLDDLIGLDGVIIDVDGKFMIDADNTLVDKRYVGEGFLYER